MSINEKYSNKQGFYFLKIISITLGILVLQGKFLWAQSLPPYRPFQSVWEGIQDIPNEQDAIIFIGGSIATGVAFSYDHQVQQYFYNHNRIGNWQVVGNFWGTGIPGVIFGSACVGYGLWKNDPHELQYGEAQLEALAVDGTIVQILKRIVLRERPNGADKFSFPSGHTSAAFTVAGSLMGMYGWKLGVPALALGVLTAVSRMDVNVHWLSDTVFGATLGYIIGRAFTIHHLQELKKLSLSIQPMAEADGSGVQVQMNF
jgi:hypothetical protein